MAYYDDVVIVNQLSPRAKEQKLGTIIVQILYCTSAYCNMTGVIYYQLANLYRFWLESINLVAIFNCSLLKYHSFDSILKPFTDDLKALQEVLIHACMQ